MTNWPAWRWGVLACLMLTAPLLTVLNGWTYWQLRRDSVEATGVVTGLTIHRRFHSRRFVVRYRFRDGSGTRHSGRQSIGPDFYRRLSEGQRIGVVYSASNPSANAVSLESLHDTVAGFSLLSLVLALVAAGGAWLWRQMRTNPEWQTP